MVGEIFQKILDMSLVGCYSVLIVLAARGLLWKCERKYSYYLWFIVFINLILPVSLESPFSLIPRSLAEFSIGEEMDGSVGNMSRDAGAIKSSQEMQEGDSSPVQAKWDQDSQASGLSGAGYDKGEQTGPVQDTWGMDLTGNEAPSREISALYPDTSFAETLHEGVVDKELSNRKLLFQRILGLVWILGIAVILGINAAGYLRLKLRIRNGKILSLDKENRIKVVDSVQTAFVCGMIRPWVYLPAGMSEEEKAYITAHEQYHRRRRDYLLKAVALCITAVHWFNPFAWIALLLFCQDMEVSCDEKVLEHTNGQIRKQYAASLLKFAAMQNGFLVTSLNFGKPALESRIKNVLKEKKKSVLITVTAIIGVLAVAMGLFLRPQSGKQAEDGGNVPFSEDGSGGTESPDSQTAPEKNQQNMQLIDLSKAIEISLDQNATGMAMLLKEDFSLEMSEGTEDEEKGIYWSIRECTMNRNNAFFVKGYYLLMGQNDFMSQIYGYDIEWDQEMLPHQSAMLPMPKLLYQTAEGVRLNELQANEQYLYWVECGYEEDQAKVCQYELETGELTVIAACAPGSSISVSDAYVTWYDHLDDGSAEVVIYDVKVQSFKEMQTQAPGEILSMSRVDLTENGIAYFSQDGEGNIYVNRYDMASGKIYTLPLGPEEFSEKLTNCFSNSDFIGWSTLKTDRAHGSDTYFFYNMESGDLYRWNGSGEMNAICKCTSRFLCVFDKENNRIFVYDFLNKSTCYQDMDRENLFIPWAWNQNGNVIFESHMNSEIKLYSVDFVYACTDSVVQGENP